MSAPATDEPEPLRPALLFATIAGSFATVVLVTAALVPWLGLAGVGAASLIGLAVPTLLIARRHHGVGRTLGLTRPPTRALVGAILLGASMWLVVLGVLAPLLDVLPDRGETEANLAPIADAGIWLPVRLLVFAVIPGLAEELLFRGLVCRHLAARFGIWIGVAISALAFAAVHLSLAQGIPALATGFAFGLAALWSGSTVTAMVVHFLNNAAVVVFAAPDLALGSWIMGIPGPAFAVALMATVTGAALIRSSRRSRLLT